MRRDPEPPEDAVSIDPEQVCFIILKAREFDAKTAPHDPGGRASIAADHEVDVLEDFADDPTRQELTEAIEALNDDQHHELVALMWLGRGDFGVEDWDEAVSEAAAREDHPTAVYLTGTPLVGDYLAEGYAALGYSCAEYESGRL